jgi:type VI secretion system protein ImpJ
MRQLQPVLWTKGVLLTPQHLQTQDRFLEDLLQFRLAALTFCPWGFRRLEIDREALAAGSFALGAASGIFPDGLLFDMPAADPLPAPKSLEGLWEQDQEWLDVYLAVPEYRPGATNVAGARRDADARYRAEELLRRDENTGLAELPIQVARKNARLLVAGEALDGCTALRVARVRRDADAGFALDPHFVPPLLDLSASDYLLGIARRLVEILAAKSSMLAGTRRQRSQSLADFGIADVGSFWLLYTVNTYFPQLRHLFETRRGHPSDLYSVMTSLAGALTTFSRTVHPRELPAYDHENLSACFGALDETVRALLETVVPATFASLPLKVVRPSVHATAIDQDRYFAAPQLFLAVAADVKPAELIARAPMLLKVGAADRVDLLIRQALAGIALTHVASPPSAVSVKLGHQYFRLDASGPEWDAVVRARNLAAYVPDDFVNAQLELVIVLPQ